MPVYGRRRIGKTELLRHFSARHRGVFHVGKVAPAALQLREFLLGAATTFQEPLLAETATDSWKRALELVVARWKGPGKLVLILTPLAVSAQTVHEAQKFGVEAQMRPSKEPQIAMLSKLNEAARKSTRTVHCRDIF